MEKIWAKSKLSSGNVITLKEHTLGLLEQFEKLKTVFDSKSEILEIHDLLKLAIFAHDIGKVYPAFQFSVGNWDYSPKIPLPDISHSLFSLLWLNCQQLDEKDEDIFAKVFADEFALKILLSAIAFHHWRDNFHNIILGNDPDFIRVANQILHNNQLRTKLLENLKGDFNCEEFNKYLKIIDFNEDIAQTVSNGKDLLSYIIPPYYNYFLPARVSLDEKYKKRWVYTVGLLIRIDHFTSFIQEEELSEKIENHPVGYSIIEEKIKDALSKKLSVGTDGKIWQLEEVRGRQNKNIILIAPTGCGKTEFAYLWGADCKLFFTLPLRSAVNAIYERSIIIFNQANVGLLHSDADAYLYEKSPNHEGERFRILDMARQLSLPVLVSTGDQIFPTALKYPGYEKLYATLGYSKIVIDEVQAYDPRAVAIIVKLIEDVVKLGGKFLLMTATLPPFVKKQIEERIGEENFEVIDKYDDYSDICKHSLEIRNDDITNSINEIIGKAKEGKRVLVILNTIDTAQKLYEKLKELNKDNIYLKLIHSRFTFEDRRRIENELVGTGNQIGKFSNPKPDNEKDGKILVSTQVVEASLDIDADILYTELAPLDSLIQRMGRVLRRVRDKETFKKYLMSKPPNEPNIIVFFQMTSDTAKLSSGVNTVYPFDLLVFSLELLLLRNADTNLKSKITELRKKYWPEEEKKQVKTKKTKDVVEHFLQDILKNVGSVNSSILLSEVEKKKYVENLYKNLPIDSKYFRKFYETLDILDAGYMSEKKAEALRLFREIYTLPVVPDSKKENFKDELSNYLKKDVKDLNYTSFKVEVLSKFVVNINARSYFRRHEIALSPIVHWIYELSEEDERKLKKVKKWLEDIYMVKCGYDSEIGVKSDVLKSSDNIF